MGDRRLLEKCDSRLNAQGGSSVRYVPPRRLDRVGILYNLPFEFENRYLAPTAIEILQSVQWLTNLVLNDYVLTAVHPPSPLVGRWTSGAFHVSRRQSL